MYEGRTKPQMIASENDGGDDTASFSWLWRLQRRLCKAIVARYKGGESPTGDDRLFVIVITLADANLPYYRGWHYPRPKSAQIRTLVRARTVARTVASTT